MRQASGWQPQAPRTAERSANQDNKAECLHARDVPSWVLHQPPCQLALDLCLGCGETLAAAFEQALAAACMSFDGTGKLRALEVHRAIGGLIADEGFVTRQIDELPRVEFFAEFAVQMLGISEADTKGDEGADIAKDGFPHSGGELGDVLMAQSEIEPVFPRLGQDGGEALGGEVLELIDEEIKIAPLVLWLPIAGHGGELELRDEQGAEQVGLVVADLALGEIGDEDASLVHDKGDAHLVAHLADDVADDGGEKQLADLVLDRGDGLAHEARLPALEFVLPEIAEEGIVDLVHHPSAIGSVGEQSVEAEESGIRAMRESRDGVVQDVFEPWPPAFMPETLEGAHDAGCNQMAILGRGLRKQIESDGVIEVARMEIDRLLGPNRRNVKKQILRQIAVRVDEADTVALLDELKDEIAQERRLPGTCFSDDVGVVAGISQIETKRHLAAPRLPHADVKIMLFHVCVQAAQASRRSRKEHE